MCFTIKLDKNFKADTEKELNRIKREYKKIATEDIVCYKYLTAGSFYPPFYGRFEYVPGKLHRNKLDSKFYWDNFIIDEGFHSLKSPQYAARYRVSNIIGSVKLHKFIIPKGATYYENKNQYCSNKIILIKK